MTSRIYTKFQFSTIFSNIFMIQSKDLPMWTVSNATPNKNCKNFGFYRTKPKVGIAMLEGYMNAHKKFQLFIGKSKIFKNAQTRPYRVMVGIANFW